MLSLRSIVVSLIVVSTSTVAFADESLSLSDALKLARANNGSVKSAYLSYESAKASARQAYAPYLPSLTASYSRSDTKTDGPDSFGSSNFQGANSSLLTLDWNLWDNGKKDLVFRQAALAAKAQEGTALQTLRSTLFTVHQRFYDALRAQELLKVNRAQVDRAQKILEQTQVRVDLKDAARKDILQATADALNARASLLQSQSQVATSQANLKSVIGFEGTKLPNLIAGEKEFESLQKEGEISLDKAMETGIGMRSDLKARRDRIASQKSLVQSAKLDSMATVSLDGRLQKSFGDSRFNQTRLALSVSVPLFDGARTKENLRQAELNYQAAQSDLSQAEREARAEIESAFYEYMQNGERFSASQAALSAARVNYEAALEAQKLGAGDLISVLTAQVSLVTAETNAVQALYDLLIGQVRLKLVTGQAMPGEEDSK